MPVDAAAAGSTLTPEIFRLAIEASPSGNIFVNGDGLIVLVNQEVERLFGYRRDELVGQPVEILLPEKMRGRHINFRAGFHNRPGSRHLGTGREFLGRCKDGSECPIEVGLNPLRIGSEFVVLCAIVDISERKRIERLHDEFVTTVSHELRTPMTSIAGSLGLMIGGAVGSLSPSAAHLIEIAHANCRRLVRLVNDILDIKKLESGQMEFHFQRCGARALVEQAIEANRGYGDDFTVRLRLEAAAEAFAVQVDPDRFVQVITNLLSNAVKFSPVGEDVVVTLETRGDNIHITVRDHGSGIPDEFKPRIFEKFAQAKTVRGDKKSGTGLGLSIVRQIVMHMHGQIGFDDAPGGGTIFYVDFPAADHLAQWDAEFAGGTDQAPLVPGDEVRPTIARERATAG